MGKSIRNLSSVTVVGLDLAKNVFQVDCGDGDGGAVVARPIRRADVLSFFASLPPCLVGMEACSSAHQVRIFMAYDLPPRFSPSNVTETADSLRDTYI